MLNGLVRLCIALMCLIPAPRARAGVVQIFVVAGQSNAVGSGANADHLPPELHGSHADVLFWYQQGGLGAVDEPSIRLTSGMQFVPLQYQLDPEGLAFDVPAGFGPEIKLGRDLSDAMASDVAVLKFAFNATSLFWEWDPDRPGSLYAQLLAEIDAAVSELAVQGHTARVSGICWMQGEADAWSSSSVVAAYQANLTQFIEQLRDALGDPALPFLFGRLNAQIWRSPYGITQPRLAAIRTAQQNVDNTVPVTVMIDTDDLPLDADFIHFVAAGETLLGQRFADAYLGLRPAIPADYDADRDVDASDVGRFANCQSGANIAYQPSHVCRASDLDDDGDVDQSDFGVLQRCHSGEGVAADPACDE